MSSFPQHLTSIKVKFNIMNYDFSEAINLPKKGHSRKHRLLIIILTRSITKKIEYQITFSYTVYKSRTLKKWGIAILQSVFKASKFFCK